jgi:hypothetical protein
LSGCDIGIARNNRLMKAIRETARNASQADRLARLA